jgi:hypothetical protein
MNRIVKEHYPVEKLPEDLREGLPRATRVTVTLVPETDNVSSEQALRELLSDPNRPRRDRAEIDAWVRSMRDE